jgi:Skp family chaperone for outer membrane proteins
MNRTYWTGFLSGTTVLAIGMVAVLAGSGFQGANQKIGVIDSNGVIQQIAVAKNMVEDERNMKSDRETILQFLQRYPIIKKEEAEKFKNLSIKPNKTDADKAELEKLKTTATEAVNKFKALELKSSPSQEELKQLDEYRNRKNDMGEYLQGLVKDFSDEYSSLHEKNQNALFELFKVGLAEVGKKQAFTLVLDKNVAPFGANDITDDVTKAAAKK